MQRPQSLFCFLKMANFLGFNGPSMCQMSNPVLMHSRSINPGNSSSTHEQSPAPVNRTKHGIAKFIANNKHTMTLAELTTAEELTDFLNSNSDACVITFSATWCGPCKASKPRLTELAATSPIPIGYVYEEDLEDFLDVFVEIKAFPTYIVFKNGKEVQRVEGVNFPELEKMIEENKP